jgi:hypothetical protein
LIVVIWVGTGQPSAPDTGSEVTLIAQVESVSLTLTETCQSDRGDCLIAIADLICTEFHRIRNPIDRHEKDAIRHQQGRPYAGDCTKVIALAAGLTDGRLDRDRCFPC